MPAAPTHIAELDQARASTRTATWPFSFYEVIHEGDGSSDRTITAKIRRSIVADKSLSMYGHNVKIIPRNGMVTLAGERTTTKRY